MQDQDTQKTNVISLFESRKKAAADAEQAEAAKAQSQKAESFLDVMKQNEKNKDRVAKERANANKSVLRSYRIKH